MLNLKYCTLTGIDEKTELSKLWSLSKRYPFVEFGVLFSHTPKKNYRYPDKDFLKDIVDFKTMFDIRMSLHICGDAIYDLGMPEQPLNPLIENFDRVQININLEKRPMDVEVLQAFIDRIGIPVITQHNHTNRRLTSELRGDAHHVLFDSSLGTGILINPTNYISNKFCGYAGGLSIGNLPVILPMIEEIAQGKPTWIDMESSLRTDDWFDVSKAQEVLKYIRTQYF